MANISFNSKKGLIQHGFKDVAIRQKKESDHWYSLDEGQEFNVYWKMRSNDKEVLLETEVKQDSFTVEVNELNDELAERAGFNSTEELEDHIYEKYGDDYRDHEYVVIIWET